MKGLQCAGSLSLSLGNNHAMIAGKNGVGVVVVVGGRDAIQNSSKSKFTFLDINNIISCESISLSANCMRFFRIVLGSLRT